MEKRDHPQIQYIQYEMERHIVCFHRTGEVAVNAGYVHLSLNVYHLQCTSLLCNIFFTCIGFEHHCDCVRQYLKSMLNLLGPLEALDCVMVWLMVV